MIRIESWTLGEPKAHRLGKPGAASNSFHLPIRIDLGGPIPISCQSELTSVARSLSVAQILVVQSGLCCLCLCNHWLCKMCCAIFAVQPSMCNFSERPEFDFMILALKITPTVNKYNLMIVGRGRVGQCAQWEPLLARLHTGKDI